MASSDSSPDRLLVRAPAKVNLALAVGPPGDSGLHPIASWMVTIDLCDDLELRRLPEGSLSRFSIEWHPEARQRRAIDWSITSDLAVRAHQGLERCVGRALPVQLRLRKRIPIGGGLGGGSSDAAAMIGALVRLFELPIEPRDRTAIAGGLGSDVPFLLDGGSALVEGVGDRLQRLGSPPPLHLTLLLPAEGCATGAVYRRFDGLGAPPFDAARVRALAARCHPPEGAPLRPEDPFNDLAEPAFLEHPPLRGLAAAFTEIAGRPAHVSGSGSTLFVVAADAAEARSLATQAEGALGVPAVAATSVTA